MAAAVARAETVEKVRSSHSEPKRAVRGRTKRRIKARAPMLSLVMLFLMGLVLPFAYTNVYATLTKTSYSKSDYEHSRWTEKVENQRLKLLIEQHSSYGRIKAGAMHMGMVRADRYEYMDQAQTVARR